MQNLLAEAAEKIKREAYAAGWRDAVHAIDNALKELVDPSLTYNIGPKPDDAAQGERADVEIISAA